MRVLPYPEAKAGVSPVATRNGTPLLADPWRPLRRRREMVLMSATGDFQANHEFRALQSTQSWEILANGGLACIPKPFYRISALSRVEPGTQSQGADLPGEGGLVHLALLPRGKIEARQRVVRMLAQMDRERFGHCSNTEACQVECPQEISFCRSLA